MAETIVVTQTSNPIIQVSSPGPQGIQGPNPYLDFVSGKYYRPQGNVVAFTVVTNRVYYSLFFVPKTQTFDQIALRTSAALSGTGAVRLGIYNNVNGKPGTVLTDYGTVAVTATSTVYPIAISLTLSAGFYWLAGVQQTAPVTGSYYGNSGNIAAAQTFQNLPYETTSTSSTIAGYYQDSVTGAFATAVPVFGSTQTMGIVPFLRAA